MKNVLYMIIAGLLVFGGVHLLDGWMDLKEAQNLSEAADRAVQSACLTGFTESSLTEMANRESLNDLENRRIVLNKSAAASKVAETLQTNLNLDSAFVPKTNSKIKSRQPLNVVIRIINESETPVVINGTTVNSTTIYISFDIPIIIKGKGAIIPKEYFWNSATFLANGQT